MKAAKLHIAVLEFTCPDCGEFLESQTGSHMFDLSEPLPQTVECNTPCCGLTLKIPQQAHQIKAGK